MKLWFGEFDLILSMDWLVEHQDSLDCGTKRVVLRIEDDKEVVVISERRDYLSNVISLWHLKSWLEKGVRCTWPMCVIQMLLVQLLRELE